MSVRGTACAMNIKSFATQTMEDDCRPPLQEVPMGTSLRRRSRTESRKRCRKRSAASGIERPASLRVGFFFQAEDGIRDYKVTGVQTCALPILLSSILLPAAVGVRVARIHD